MLRKFIVSNFKCFEKDFELDLTDTRGYGFNSECVKNGIVNNAIIYGYNGSGKSNLNLAIFDIIAHLTDKEKNQRLYHNYLNAYSECNNATFYYEFEINSKVVVYEYKKKDYTTIISERLTIDDKVIIDFDRENTSQATINLEGAENLNTSITNVELSALKYVRNNTELANSEVNDIFNGFFQFIDNMLFFKSLEVNTYLGCYKGSEDYISAIIDNDKVDEFEQFLNDADVECKLKVVDDYDGKNIHFDFGGKSLPFATVASTGTKSLALFFFWYMRISKNEISFLMIDEFDAFYHNRVARVIVNKLKQTGMQFLLTSHNVAIMTNDLLRPDCYFSMNKNKIASFANLTDKELRQAHNLEKMYKGRMFDVE